MGIQRLTTTGGAAPEPPATRYSALMAPGVRGCPPVVVGQSGAARRPRVLVASWLISESTRRMLDGIRAFLRENGLEWDIEALSMLQTDTIRLALEAERPDGVVMGFDAPQVAASLAATTMPVVFLRFGAGDPAPRRRLSVLRLGFANAGRMAAHHFLDRGGFRSFAFVEATQDPAWSLDRGRAFQETVERASGDFRRFSAADGIYQAAIAHRSELTDLAAWLRTLPRPAAVFAATDERAREVILACREAGLDVPRSVAVLGVNNDDFSCRHIIPNLSSIELDHAALGHVAAEELQRLFDRHRARRYDFAVPVRRLVARASTAPASPGGSLVRRALDFIDAHALDGIGSADVVRELGVSRSLLDLRFRELGGGTVLQAIQERRLREVARQLLETDDSIEEICRAVGAGDVSGLRRLFRRRFGCSMREWRKTRSDGSTPT